MPVKKVSRSRLESILEKGPDELVRIYSYQTSHILNGWEEKGFISGAPEFGDNGRLASYGEEWERPYSWMHSMMAERITDFSGDYPVWAWPVRQSERGSGKYRKKETHRIIALVPRKRILFSDYECWHSILNGVEVCHSEAEWNEFNKRWPYHYSDYPAEKQESYFEAIQKTWPRILDVKWVTDPNQVKWAGQNNMIQLCVDRIYANEIQEIREWPVK